MNFQSAWVKFHAASVSFHSDPVNFLPTSIGFQGDPVVFDGESVVSRAESVKYYSDPCGSSVGAGDFRAVQTDASAAAGRLHGELVLRVFLFFGLFGGRLALFGVGLW
jgi:hypothetical protein